MRRQRRNIYLSVGVAVIVVLLAIFFVLVYVNQQEQAPKTAAPITKTNKVKKKSAFADLSIRQIVGLSIVYAHLKYQDDDDWNEVYDQAEHNNLDIQRYQQYHFDDNRVIEASGKQRLYILNKKTALVITNADEAQNSSILLGNSEKQLGAINLKAAYQYVAQQGKTGDWRTLSQHLNVSDQVQVQEKSESSQSENDEKENSGTDLSQFRIPDQFLGRWYSADNHGKVNVLTVSVSGVDGHPLFKDNQQLRRSKKFQENTKLREKIWFAEIDGDKLCYGPDGVDTQILQLKGNALIRGASNGPMNAAPKYYRSEIQAKQHPYRY